VSFHKDETIKLFNNCISTTRQLSVLFMHLPTSMRVEDTFDVTVITLSPDNTPEQVST